MLVRLLLSLLAVLGCSIAAQARPLRIATWNVEHLHDREGQGCKPRSKADYTAMAEHVKRLDADVIALQEVRNKAAALRVLGGADYTVFLASPSAEQMDPTHVFEDCFERQGARLTTQLAGFAVRKSLLKRGKAFARDVAALEIAYEQADAATGKAVSGTTRKGLELRLEVEGRVLTLLSVHLKHGCIAAERQSRDNPHCGALMGQTAGLRAWIGQREREGSPYLILGDFNRRFESSDLFFWPAIRPDGVDAAGLWSPTFGQKQPASCRTDESPYIDHIVLGRAARRWMREGSLKVMPWREHTPLALSDHCPILVELEVPPRISGGLHWFRASAEHRLLTDLVLDKVRARADQIATEAGMVKDGWSVSFDADETLIDNSDYNLELELAGQTHSAASWAAWTKRRAAGAIPGAFETVRHVLDRGARVVVITNRTLEEEADTWENLAALWRAGRDAGAEGATLDARRVCLLGRERGRDEESEGRNDKDRRRRMVETGALERCELRAQRQLAPGASDEAIRDAAGRCFGAIDPETGGRLPAAQRPNACHWALPLPIKMHVGDQIGDFPCLKPRQLHAAMTAQAQGDPGLLASGCGDRSGTTLGDVMWRTHFLLPNPVYGRWDGNEAVRR